MSINDVKELLDIELPAPYVLEVDEDGVMSPVRGSGVAVAIDYDGVRYDDRIRFYWNGVYSPPEYPGKPNGPLVRSYMSDIVAPDLGKSVSVWYEVVRQNGETETSARSTFFLRNFEENELPMPRMDQDVSGGILDTRYLKDTVLVTVRRWPLMVPGQKVWLSLAGASSAGQPLEITVWDGTFEDNREEVVIAVAIRTSDFNFSKFKNGSSMQLDFHAVFSGDPDDLEGVTFSTLNFELVNTPSVHTYQSFDNLTDQLIGPGESLPLPGMTLSILDGPLKCGVETLGNIPGFREGPALVLCKGGEGNAGDITSYKIEFDDSYISIRVCYTRSVDYGLSISFFDENGASVGIAHAANGAEGEFYFISPPFKRLKTMNVLGRREACLDFFTLSK